MEKNPSLCLVNAGTVTRRDLLRVVIVILKNEIKHAARVLSRYRDARRTRILRIRLRLTVRVNKTLSPQNIKRVDNVLR